MADILQSMRTYFLAKTAITDIVGQRIYCDQLPQNATVPAATLLTASERYEHALDGLGGVVATRLQIECYADTRSTTLSLADAIIWCGADQIKGVQSGIDIRSVIIEDGRRSYNDPDTSGGDRQRYVTTFDMLIHWLRS